jgi:hypothetical protein
VNAKRRSAREAAANCLAKFDGIYNRGVDMSSGVTRRGSAFHAAAFHYILGLWETKQRADFELAAAAIHRAHVENPLPNEEWLDCESLWARFVERFELPLEQFYIAESGGEFMGAEMRFDLVLVPNETTLRIPDWKSHWRIPPQSEVEDWFQTFFYLAAARHLYPGFQTYEMSYEFVRFGQSILVSKTHAELDAFVTRIEQIDQAIAEAEQTGVYPATPGKHCGTCRLLCERANPLRAVPHRLDTYEAAQAAISDYRAITTRAEQLREALMLWGETNGPVRTESLFWGFVPKDHTTYPVREVVKALADAKVEPQFKFEMSASAVKPLLGKKYAPVHDALKALARTTTRTVYGPKPVDDEKDVTE